MKISNLLAVAGLVAAATSAQAVAIPGLVNTGIGAAGTIDTNYKFGVVTGTATGTPCAGGACGVVTTDASFPLTVWLANSASAASSWLTPTITQGQSYDPSANGIYTWTLTFDLTGFIPSTASLAGRFLADNSATVQLNGGSILATANSFSTWTTFSAAAGFVSGLNTLTFTALNTAQSPSIGANPTGIRVEFTSSNVSAVPEPSAMLLSLAGLAMVGGLAKRRLANRA
jgi:hypothetical protein